MPDDTRTHDTRNRAPLLPAGRFLSLVLRHRPQSIGLELDAHGWADIDALIARAPAELRLDRAAIAAVVAGDDKRRFAISADGLRIRAQQGHSLDIDLGLSPAAPPGLLFHGTATRFVDAIRREGLTPRSRRHVHLSCDADTARTVGSRHGKPQVLRVDAAAMAAAGHVFHRTENGVWLTARVPVDYIDFADLPRSD